MRPCSRRARRRRALLTVLSLGTSLVGFGVVAPPALAAECSGKPATYEMDPSHHSYTAGNAGEVIIGTPGDDIIKGGTGSDTICGMGGDDIIEGGGGSGWDQLYGGSGDDHIYTQSQTGWICCLSWAYGESGSDVLVGGIGGDFLGGGSGRDELDGGAGDDTLWGGPGSDRIFGGPGKDDISGGSTAKAETGIQHQTSTPGDGPDQLYGGDDPDKIYGDSGNDTIDALDSWSDDVGGGPGSSDRCFVQGDNVTPDCEKLS